MGAWWRAVLPDPWSGGQGLGRRRRAGARRALAFMVLAGLLAPGMARADAASSPAGWLTWSSSSALCGNAGEFAAGVERALGRPPALVAGDAHVNVSARIEAAAGAGAPRWVGQVQLRSADQRELGSRTIDRRDVTCQPLVEALAVVTALVLSDDGMVSAPPAASGDRGSPAALAPPPSARAEVLATLAPAPTPRLRLGVEGVAKMGLGFLPRAAFGAEVALRLRGRDGVTGVLSFTGWRRQTVRDELGRGAVYQRLEVGLGLCPLAVARGRWDAAACLGGAVGRLRVVGVGLATTSSEDRMVLDAGLGVALTRHLTGPLDLGLTAGLTVPLIRDRISYETSDGAAVAIFRESPVALIVGLRVTCHF